MSLCFQIGGWGASSNEVGIICPPHTLFGIGLNLKPTKPTHYRHLWVVNFIQFSSNFDSAKNALRNWLLDPVSKILIHIKWSKMSLVLTCLDQ